MESENTRLTNTDTVVRVGRAGLEGASRVRHAGSQAVGSWDVAGVTVSVAAKSGCQVSSQGKR